MNWWIALLIGAVAVLLSWAVLVVLAARLPGGSCSTSMLLTSKWRRDA